MGSDSGMTRVFLFVVLSLLSVLPAWAQETPPRPWVIATYAYPQRDRAAAIQPLADYLGLRARHPVQVRLFDSPTALVDALRRGEVDVAVPNLHGYLQARRASETLTTLPVPQVPALQADRYRAVLIARQGLEAPGELERQAKTLRLMLVGRDSASGGFVPVRELRRRGLEPAKPSAILLTPDPMRPPWRPWRREGQTSLDSQPMSTTPTGQPAWPSCGARSPFRPARCCADPRPTCRASSSRRGCSRPTRPPRP